MQTLADIFGPDSNGDLQFPQIAARTLVIYCVGLLTVRIGKSRILSQATPMDVLVAFILGSLLSRGITGSASLIGTFVASITLIAAHAAISLGAYHSRAWGKLTKGHARALVKNGKIDWASMRQSHVTRHDLGEAMRRTGSIRRVRDIQLAVKERNGEITVVCRK